MAAVDHVIYDAATGNRTCRKRHGSGQASTQVGFQGMLIDPLAGFQLRRRIPVAAAAAAAAATPWPIRPRGFTIGSVRFYDSVSPRPTSPARPATPAVPGNPYEFEGDVPTGTGIVMADPPGEFS